MRCSAPVVHRTLALPQGKCVSVEHTLRRPVCYTHRRMI
jgi:hypothetical protein